MKRRYPETESQVNANNQQLRKVYWNNFTKRMERDVFAAPRKIWRILRRWQELNEYIETK